MNYFLRRSGFVRTVSDFNRPLDLAGPLLRPIAKANTIHGCMSFFTVAGYFSKRISIIKLNQEFVWALRKWPESRRLRRIKVWYVSQPGSAAPCWQGVVRMGYFLAPI